MCNSKHENTDIDNKGSKVVNDIFIQPTSLENGDIIFLVYVITIVVVLHLALKLYKMWHNNVRKRYLNRAQSTAQI